MTNESTNLAAQASSPVPEYEYSKDGKTVTWKNSDECRRAALASDEQAALEKQLTTWRAEVARLNDLIVHASGAQASDEPMRRAFEAWAGAERYRFVTLSRAPSGNYVHPAIQYDWIVWQAATPRATADGERDAALLIEDLSKWTGVGGMIKADMFVGRAKAIIAATKPGEPT